MKKFLLKSLVPLLGTAVLFSMFVCGFAVGKLHWLNQIETAQSFSSVLFSAIISGLVGLLFLVVFYWWVKT